MRGHHFVIALAFAAVPVRAPVAAQAPVAPGELVRVVIPGNGRNGGNGDQYVVGTLARLAGDTATMLVDSTGWRPDTVRYALDDSAGRRLEHVVARRSHAGKGAVMGALVGAGVGAVIGGSSQADSYIPGAAGTAIVLAIPGALLGYLGGSASHTETWGPVPTHGVRIGVSPTSVRLTLTL